MMANNILHRRIHIQICSFFFFFFRSISSAAPLARPMLGIGGGVIRRQRMPVGATLNADGGSLLLSSLAFGPDMDLTIQHSARDGLTLYARGVRSRRGRHDRVRGGRTCVLGLDGAGQQHATLDPPENIAVRTDGCRLCRPPSRPGPMTRW